MKMNQEERDAAYREYVNNVGMDRKDQCWVLTVFDTWERNPHYDGPDEPHPEDDSALLEMLDNETLSLYNYADQNSD